MRLAPVSLFTAHRSGWQKLDTQEIRAEWVNKWGQGSPVESLPPPGRQTPVSDCVDTVFCSSLLKGEQQVGSPKVSAKLSPLSTMPTAFFLLILSFCVKNVAFSR